MILQLEQVRYCDIDIVSKWFILFYNKWTLAFHSDFSISKSLQHMDNMELRNMYDDQASLIFFILMTLFYFYAALINYANKPKLRLLWIVKLF